MHYRFSNESQTLQSFVQNHLWTHTVASLHSPVIHTSLFKRLEYRSQQWKCNPPMIRSHSMSVHTDTNTKKIVFQLPSKLHVLRILLTTSIKKYVDTGALILKHASARSELKNTKSVYTQYTDKKILVDRLQRVVDSTRENGAQHLQWFHNHAHGVLAALSDTQHAHALTLLHHPEIDRAMHLWSSFPNLYDYFVPLNVQHALENDSLKKVSFTWTFLKKKHTIHVIVSTSMMVTVQDMMHKCFIVSMLSSLEKNHCEHLHIHWFPSVCKKSVGVHNTRCTHEHTNTLIRTQKSCSSCSDPATNITTPSVIWNPYQINTGSTYRIRCDSIHVWRKEESDKTFLHEMLHGYGWDFDAPVSVEQFMKSHFSIAPDTNILFFEAYVETWATILNIYLLVLHNHVNDEQSDSIFSKFSNTKHSQSVVRAIRHYLKMEQSFVLFQVAKVLLHSGFESWNMFFHKDTSTNAKNCVYAQNTSVFSYFVVRSALLWDLSWFTSHFENIHYDSNHSVHRLGWYSNWCQHLGNVFSSNAYQNSVNRAIRIIQQMCVTNPSSVRQKQKQTRKRKKTMQRRKTPPTRKSIIPSWISTTMRMTCIERYDSVLNI